MEEAAGWAFKSCARCRCLICSCCEVRARHGDEDLPNIGFVCGDCVYTLCGACWAEVAHPNKDEGSESSDAESEDCTHLQCEKCHVGLCVKCVNQNGNWFCDAILSGHRPRDCMGLLCTACREENMVPCSHEKCFAALCVPCAERGVDHSPHWHQQPIQKCERCNDARCYTRTCQMLSRHPFNLVTPDGRTFSDDNVSEGDDTLMLCCGECTRKLKREGKARAARAAGPVSGRLRER